MKKPLCEIKKVEPIRSHGDMGELKQSIADIGLINPITIDEQGDLLAGRRRYQAVKELGWQEVPVRIICLNDDPLLSFRISLDENLKRRNLSDLETAIVIKGCDELGRELEGEQPRGKHRSSLHRNDDGWSQDRTARELNISRPAVSKSIKIASAVEEYPELAKFKKGGRILVEAKQMKLRSEIAERAHEFTGECIKIYHGDFRQITQQFDNNSINHIITDPPYGEQYLELWGELAMIADRILKPGGFCITYSGVFHLDKVIRALSQHLVYYWQVILLHTGLIQPIYPRRINTGYKPLLIFAKEPIVKPLEFVSDIIQGTGREKMLHKWGQAGGEAEELIGRFTNQGDLILDPFAGSGTVMLACQRTNRRGIAIESDESMIPIIKGRLSGK